ncbi:GAF domain-containing protein [Streptomyces prasinus]|uniref:GAF domain-containing protein n=1 Tax=Streptomyces prasinus TaxID=67345 RepID=UPI0006EB58EA|nr:GAF domain-containing protein [Streptomyces prasinus]
MSYDPPRPAGRLLLTPEDTEAPARIERLRRLGLGERPEPTLDAFAYGLAGFTGAAYAMVNFLGQGGQFFAGLHTPAVAPVLRGDGTGALLGRSLPRDHGFCPHVVVRRKALVLGDVSDYPRFAGNPVVDEFGVRSYLGAPLIDSTGMVLGTVSVSDTRPRAWGQEGLAAIKGQAADLIVRIERGQSDGLPF